ncbi:MAG: lysophospholipid acyltransferase family protein [Planctomycetota bacterium]
MTGYLLYRIMMFISLTFPLRFTYWVALRVADLHYLFDRRARECVRKNIRRILGAPAPESRVRYETRWTFRHFGKYLGEFFRFDRFDRTFLDQYVRVEEVRHIDEALKRGKGCIALSAHFTNWELGLCNLAFLGYPVNAIVREHVNPRVNDLFLRQRTGKGIRVFFPGAAVRSCFAALAGNEIVAILGDRDFSGKGIAVDFFGAKAVFPRGPAHLALRTGAVIIPTFFLRRSNDAFVLRFHPPIAWNPAADHETQAREIIEAYARLCEEYISRDPSLWCVFDDFWGEPMRKERPLGGFHRKAVTREA